jgi:hypothetical protein
MAITSLKDQYDLALVTSLRERIEAGLMRVSRFVRAEGARRPYPATADLAADMNVERARKRQLLASAVRQQVQAYTERFAREVADSTWIKNNATRTADGSWDLSLLTDNALLRECALSWDEQSGVLPSETP